MYRKGIDLQVAIIPQLCWKFPQLRIVIGGDGPMRIDLERMLDEHDLHEQVTLVGSVQHEHARDLLVSGLTRSLNALSVS